MNRNLDVGFGQPAVLNDPLQIAALCC